MDIARMKQVFIQVYWEIPINKSWIQFFVKPLQVLFEYRDT